MLRLEGLRRQNQTPVPRHGEWAMPRLGRQKQAERCSAKLERGAARAGDQRSGWGGGAWALSGLEAGGHRGQGGGEAECGGSVKPEGGREEVGSAKGAMGKSQCQLGAGWEGSKGRERSPYSFPRSCFVLQEKQMSLLVSCKTQELQAQRALWGHRVQSLLCTDGDSGAHSGELVFPKLPVSLVTGPELSLPVCTGLCHIWGRRVGSWEVRGCQERRAPVLTKGSRGPVIGRQDQTHPNPASSGRPCVSLGKWLWSSRGVDGL